MLKGDLFLVLTYSGLSKTRFPSVRCYWECFVVLVATLYLGLKSQTSRAASGKKSCNGGVNFVGVFLFCFGLLYFLRWKTVVFE